MPIAATFAVLVFVVALSAAAIEAGRARTTSASGDLASPAPLSSDHRATSSPISSATHSAPLIAMDGARPLTRTQLHDWTLGNTDGSANALIAEQQDWLTIQCMAAHGYLYDPTLNGSQGLERGKTWGLTQHQLEGYRVALWGQDLRPSEPYNWRTAGCHGRAVHLTEQDDDH